MKKLIMVFLFLAIILLICFLPKLTDGDGSVGNFKDVLSDREEFNLMYGTEAKLFLSKKRIPVSCDFAKYVRQNNLKIFSCFTLTDKGKLAKVTIKYVRGNAEPDDWPLNEKFEEIAYIPEEPHVLAEYKIDFPWQWCSGKSMVLMEKFTKEWRNILYTDLF